MTVQDDRREEQLCDRFNLEWTHKHKRGGTDATFEMQVGGQSLLVPVEVKSTTGDSVSTARDVGEEHIRKWRSQFWVIGFYSKTDRPVLQTTLCLTPNDIEPWVASIESKIRPDLQLATCAARAVTMADVFAICGEKEYYNIEDAKKLHKQQWTVEQYKAARDMKVKRKKVISQEKMLLLLKLRAEYIAKRGATLNNPHITKDSLKHFWKTDREIKKDWSLKFKELARNYFATTPSHPFSNP